MGLPTFDIPPIGPRQGKVWGDTQLVFAWNSVEAHVIRINDGGFCSRHSHAAKWNRFVVMRGKLAVRLFYHEHGGSDETLLSPGQVTDIPPNVRHEFEALEDTVAMELYWVPLDPHDIERHGSQGGKREDGNRTFVWKPPQPPDHSRAT